MRLALNLVIIITVALPLAAQPAIVDSFPVSAVPNAFVGGLEYDCSGGIVWIGDETNDMIFGYTVDGRFLKAYPAVSPPGTTLSPQPIGLGMNSTTGNLWIGDEGEYVYEFNPSTGLATGVSWPTTPAITDVSGVAVDPLTGNIFVSQDSGTRMIVEFDQAGVVISTVVLTGAGSTDPDGLAYDFVTNSFFTGEDSTDRILQIDRMGNLVNTFDMSPLGISPEGLGVDPANGNLIIGDGAVTDSVYIVSGILAPGGICFPNPSPFAISATTSSAADLTVEFFNVPAGTVEGWTFLSLDTTGPVGSGSVFGLEPDATTFSILTIAPVATPGNPLHWTWPAVAPTFPAAALTAPPGSTAAFAGISWDLLGIAITGSGAVTTFNVSRVDF